MQYVNQYVLKSTLSTQQNLIIGVFSLSLLHE